MGVQDFFDCINLVAKMTIERLSFGTVFFVGGEPGFGGGSGGTRSKLVKVVPIFMCSGLILLVQILRPV